MEPRIRFANAADIHVLAALGTATCYEAYFELDPSADLADYCVRIYSPENVQAEYDDEDSTFLIAEVNDRAIGFAKLRENKPVKCVEGEFAIELQRIYLLERVKRMGVGRALLNECKRIGRERGYRQIWLGVWEENRSAQAFYERIGMSKVGTTTFNDGKNDFVNFVYATDI
jgi:diamine N-acetyltransferase